MWTAGKDLEGFADLECVDVGEAFSVFFISKIKRVGRSGGNGVFFFVYQGVMILGDWPIR
jgi:hypothetical protein